MKKKNAFIFCMIASIVLVLGMAACGSKNEESEPEENPYETDVEDNTVAEPVEPPSADETTEPDDVDTDDEVFTGWSEEMTAIRTAVVDELDSDYWPQMQMNADYLEMNYGLTSDMYDDFMGEMPMMSVHIDTLLIVKAKDGQAEAVEQALEDYRQNVLDNSMQYPMNMAKSQACKVARIGNYVCFVLLGGDITEYEENGDEAIIAYCQNVNDRVIEIISENIQQ